MGVTTQLEVAAFSQIEKARFRLMPNYFGYFIIIIIIITHFVITNVSTNRTNNQTQLQTSITVIAVGFVDILKAYLN